MSVQQAEASQAPAAGSAKPRLTFRQRSLIKRVLYHLLILSLAVVVLYPGAWMILSSFRPSSEIIGNVNLIPDSFTMENYTTALSGIAGISFWTFFKNSAILSVLTVVGVLVSASVSAYAFARIKFPGRGLWFAMMIGTLLLPFHVVVIPQYIVFNNLGLLNSFFPLLLPKFLATDAFFVFLMVQFMRGLPPELDEAARVDGAGHVRIMRYMMIPLMRPAFITSAIFAFIWSWNDFFGPLLYLQQPDLFTLPLALRIYVDQTSVSNYGAQMAMAVLALIPVLLFFIAFQRYIVDGVATEGLKG